MSREPWANELASLAIFCMVMSGLVVALIAIQRDGLSHWRASAAFASVLEVASAAYYLAWVFRRF